MRDLIFRVLDSPTDQNWHSHSHAHILLPLSIELDVEYDQKVYHVSNQDLCFIPPYLFHHCYCPADVITINIPPHMIHQSDLNILGEQPVYAIDDELVPLTQLIKSEVIKNPNDNTLYYLFYYLYNKLVKFNECQSLRYIREHFDEALSVEQLAQLENYTPSYFATWFRKKTGKSPSAYLRWFRIERAKELLTDTSYSLMNIALLVGYNSHAAFTRAFKETTGISPQEYRQNYPEMRLR